MASMKQCPQCGKYVPVDRTYCMNCGVTLGIRCPDCRAVVPVGSRACTECGHSFVKKKKLFNFPLWSKMKRHAKPILGAAVLLLLILTLVAAGFPTVTLRVLADDSPLLDEQISGYTLIGYFIGGHPEAITTLLETKALKDAAPTLRALFYGEGVGWLIMLFGLAFSVCLAACNYKRMSRVTAKRLFATLGLTLGGAALVFGLSPVIAHILTDSMEVLYPAERYVLESFALWPIITVAAAAGVLALHALLFVGALRHVTGEEEELSLSMILHIPLSYAGRGLRVLFRRLSRRSRKKKGLKEERENDEPAFAVTPRFSTYIILFVVSLVFTQALLSKISHIFFWFVFLLPIVLILYVMLAKHALSVQMVSENVTTQKNTPYTYEFRIDNRSVLALPFVDAKVSIPQSNSVRCTERIVRLSLAPMTGYCMKNTVKFRFRGTYDIGVACFYVYDFFRLFRARVDVNAMSTVYVLPRRLSLDDTLAQAISDSTARTVRSPLVVDKLEVSDIRDYQNGDPLKSIHWKLSSKSENFVVKDYNTGTANETVVFCDMAPHFPDEPPGKKTQAEGSGTAAPKTRAERRAAKRAAKKAQKARREELRTEAEKAAKQKRIRETKDTHAISDDDLQTRLDNRAAAAEILDAKAESPTSETAPDTPAVIEVEDAVDVHELAHPSYYEDMNEYLADGVVELTIAMVLAELRQGHEVLLLWFDRRSDTGVFGYHLRGAEEFETIYHLFATAPVSLKPRPVTSLTAMAEHIQSAKQMFVISSLDTAMLTDLTSLPGVSDAGNFGSTEVVLYNPEERFKYPRERSSYLDGCRQQLAANGLSLTAGSFNITRPENSPEGGNTHES